MTNHPDKFRRLARRVWTAFHGPIPKGHQIHHKDLDETNFALDNLECLSIVEHRKRHIKTGLPRPCECQRCKTVFANPWPYKPARFCSNACKAAARRASGVDDEWRLCVRCGGAFEVNKYSKQRYCSQECSPNGLYERKTFKFTCRTCGQPSKASDRRAIYCSTKCRKRYDRHSGKLAVS